MYVNATSSCDVNARLVQLQPSSSTSCHNGHTSTTEVRIGGVKRQPTTAASSRRASLRKQTLKQGAQRSKESLSPLLVRFAEAQPAALVVVDTRVRLGR